MKNNPTVDEWLEKVPPDLQLITRELIAVVRKNMLGAHEFIYHDAVGNSVNDSPFDRICYIAPQKKGYVNFGFFFGAGLSDPKKLLTGEGKRLRHVKIGVWRQPGIRHWQNSLRQLGSKRLSRFQKYTRA